MITFIIPTVGRKSLIDSIKSLEDQTNPNWNAIVVFDGISRTIDETDKIKVVEIEKNGQGINSAGNVRNRGMDLVTTKWIGFLDDDDIVSNDYVDKFYKESANYSDVDVIIFRMKNKSGTILPPIDTDNFYKNEVGISFVIKKSIFDAGFEFVPSSIEDYTYLDLLRANDYKIMIMITSLISYEKHKGCTNKQRH